MSQPVIIVFTRFPRPGRVKTRLIPSLGGQGAADLYRKLVERTLDQAARASGASLEIHYTGAAEEKMIDWLGTGPIYFKQAESPDLGDRMAVSLNQALAAGAPKAVLLGCDLPGLRVEHILRAFDELDGVDVVFGPAEDGGYWLTGLKKPQIGLFTNIKWSTSEVLTESLARAGKLGLSYTLVDTLADLDRPEDLEDPRYACLLQEVRP